LLSSQTINDVTFHDIKTKADPNKNWWSIPSKYESEFLEFVELPGSKDVLKYPKLYKEVEEPQFVFLM
jgi:hypothetical protein